jgi:LacI family transcriptional regulator
MIAGRRPTLDDVAAQAGVSRSTVSRVINAHAYVADDVRAAVMRAISEIGYVPNESARALRTNRTMTVGLVVTRLRNQVFAAIAQSLDESLMAAGRTLLAGSSADDPGHEAHVVAAFLRRGVDGLVLSLVDERATALRRDIVGAGIPGGPARPRRARPRGGPGALRPP